MENRCVCSVCGEDKKSKFVGKNAKSKKDQQRRGQGICKLFSILNEPGTRYFMDGQFCDYCTDRILKVNEYFKVIAKAEKQISKLKDSIGNLLRKHHLKLTKSEPLPGVLGRTRTSSRKSEKLNQIETIQIIVQQFESHQLRIRKDLKVSELVEDIGPRAVRAAGDEIPIQGDIDLEYPVLKSEMLDASLDDQHDYSPQSPDSSPSPTEDIKEKIRGLINTSVSKIDSLSPTLKEPQRKKRKLGPKLQRTFKANLPFKCGYPDCGRSFSGEGRRIQHEKVFHGGPSQNTFNCKICCRVFNDFAKFRRHWRGKHQNANKSSTEPIAPTWSCSNCSMAFDNNDELQNHLSLHTMQGLHFTCVVCVAPSAVFSNSVDLKAHMKLKHLDKLKEAELDLGNYPCTHDGCTARLKSKRGLENHIKNHIGDLPFKCLESGCKQAFSTQAFLDRHQAVHSDEKPYLCGICGTKLKYERGLTRHLKKHEVIKEGGKFKFECKVCPKSFNDLGALKRHEETHSTIRPYVCDLCGKSFAVHHNYYLHSKIHLKANAKNPPSGQQSESN